MEKWTWVVPIIALVVWVISNLARQKEAAKQVRPVNRPPGPRPRGAGSDIDKFLDEINRRRQQQQQSERKIERAEPVVVRQQQPPKRQPNRPAADKPRPPKRRAVEEVVPVAEPVLLEVLPATAIEQRAASPIMQIVRPKTPAHLAQLRELLATPQGRRTVFLMKEILAAPRCQRPYVSPFGGSPKAS